MDDTRALLASWRRSGADARHATTLFLEADEMRRVPLGKTSKRTCTKVVAVAERRVAFTLRAARLMVESRGGVAEIEDCGEGTLRTGTVTLAMASARAAVEVLVLRYRGSIAPVDVLLPERALGPAARHGELGEPLELAPIAERIARIERVALSEGAHGVVPIHARAGQQGAGVLTIKLAAGCHRLSVLADTDGRQAPVDIDAEVSTPDEVVRRDRSHAPDARLDFCLGEGGRVELRYVGASRPLPIVVVDAFWTIPKGIPTAWGSRVRAGLAWALHRRRAPRIERAPVAQRIGVAGVTVLPFEVEPSSCYLAAFATVHQGAAGRLSVRAGGVTRYDDATEEPAGAAVSFCVPPDASVARVQVELGGQASTWLLALWRLSP